MKRILSVLLVVLMLSLALVACDQAQTPDPDGTTTIEQDPNAPANQPKPAEENDAGKTDKPEQTNQTAENETAPEKEGAEPEKPANPSESPAPQDETAPANDAPESDAARAIAKTAESLLGTAYRLGGVGPDEFDNSGFVYYCCKQNGVSVPRLASGMATAGTEVKAENLKPGDILVFSNEIGGSADFVGIYAGDGKFISCNNPDQPTGYQNLHASYWQERFLSGRRVA